MAPTSPTLTLPPALDPIEFDSIASEAPAQGTSCDSCQQDIRAIYYEAAGKVICPRCRSALESQLSPTGGRARRFGRAIGFGLLAAAAGSAAYYAFRALTGIEFGLAAVLVGFMVGKAVFIGSGRRGGRRYQILAVGLTYFAMASTYVPVAMESLSEKTSAQQDSAGVNGRDSVQTDSATAAVAANVTPDSASDSTSTPPSPGGLGILIALVAAVAFVAALPILVGFSSIIMIFILGFALVQAWRMNRAVDVTITGPYRITMPVSVAEPAT